MRIKTIGYGKLITNQNYSNKRLYVEAELSKIDDPNKAYKALKEVVDNAVYADNDYLYDDEEIPF